MQKNPGDGGPDDLCPQEKQNEPDQTIGLIKRPNSYISKKRVA